MSRLAVAALALIVAVGCSSHPPTPDGGAGGGAGCSDGDGCTLPGGAGVFDATCTCRSCGAADAIGDAKCVIGYGPGTLCLSNGGTDFTCKAATCRSTTATSAPGCSAGTVCNANNQCSPCMVTTDCTASTAYGAGYLCAGGACVQGTCVSSQDCAGSSAGQVCAGNNCAPCATDSECATDTFYASAAGGTRKLCDTSTHLCVTAACSSTLTACAGAHVCCGTTCQADTTFSTAAMGKSCCAPADCNGTGTNVCAANVCQTCSSVTDFIFYVDPANATADQGASGGNTAGCAFKSLSYALHYVATVPGVPTNRVTLRLLSDAIVSGPLVVPANVTVVGSNAAGNPIIRTVQDTGTDSTFLIQSSDVHLSYLNLTRGTMPSPSAGVAVDVEAQSTAPVTGVVLDHVFISGVGPRGIVVGSSAASAAVDIAVTVGPGVHVTDKGTGLLVSGQSSTTVSGDATDGGRTFFNNNTTGISVNESAGITINGAPGAKPYAAATVSARNNKGTGLSILQNPSPSVARKPNVVTGFVVLGGPNQANQPALPDGIGVYAGSNLKLRNSISLGNKGSGLGIFPQSSAAEGIDISGIDLGTANDRGGNTLQVQGNAGATPGPGDKPNDGVGICLALYGVTTGTGQTLKARGNHLVTTANTSVDCAMAPANTSVRQNTTCRSPAAGVMVTNAVSVGRPYTLTGDLNQIDISNCVAQ